MSDWFKNSPPVVRKHGLIHMDNRICSKRDGKKKCAYEAGTARRCLWCKTHYPYSFEKTT